jgi:hypothetical protein
MKKQIVDYTVFTFATWFAAKAYLTGGRIPYFFDHFKSIQPFQIRQNLANENAAFSLN